MSRFVIRVDPDVSRASTPPADLYRDGDWYEALLERVLATSWHWTFHLGSGPAVGECRPATLLPGSLDEPVLLSRDAAGGLHVLSNVCTHRGALIVDEPCRSAGIRCPYHGRRFHADGKLVGAPGFEGAVGFPSATDDLPRVPAGSFGPHGFASVRPATAFDAWIAPALEHLGWAGIEEYRFDPGTSRDYEVDAHWALYVENYLEGFHVPYVHAGLARALDADGYRTRVVGEGVLQVGEATGTEGTFDLPPGHPDHGRRVAAYWLWLFPATMLNLYPWGLSINAVQPLGPRRTRVAFRSFVRDASLRSVGAGNDLDRVEREDQSVVLRVMRGLRSRLYQRGRYAPAHEAGVHHFHRLLAARLEATAS